MLRLNEPTKAGLINELSQKVTRTQNTALAISESMDLVDAPTAAEGETLDGIPEWFVGPFLSELVCHEVGHTLGLRHNFKSSSIYSMQDIRGSFYTSSP